MGSTYPRYNLKSSNETLPISGTSTAEGGCSTFAAQPPSAVVSGLLFDMGDVLYDATAWRRWLIQLLRRFDLHLDYNTLFHSWDRNYLREVHRGERPLCEAFREFMDSIGLKKPQIDEIELACQARRHQLEREARPLPGVRATIGRLYESGLKLGVLSDSEYPGEELKERMQRFGLGGFFSAVVSSRDLGQTKPEPACYLRALKQMGATASESAFVGHDAGELAGARAVGMRTIAFNFDPEAQADVYIARFEELIQEVVKPTKLASVG
ncbi:MAG: HAD-IA family hydrolase [Planctomycetota bacterium]|nr:HAD-IA family hydrolase [Planctomycetota bacterium]